MEVKNVDIRKAIVTEKIGNFSIEILKTYWLK